MSPSRTRSCAFFPLFLLAFPLAGCGDAEGPVNPLPDPGALVDVSLGSRVGVVLDEIPTEFRTQAAEALLEEPEAFWIERAKRQAQLTLYRLVFRQYYYDGGKLQLPLPPEKAWSIAIDAGGAERTKVDGHDVVAVGFTLESTLLSDLASPEKAEPALAEIGGTWDEPFVLPIDPELLFQRTGYACMDESEFPANSVDGENSATFYDHECGVAPPGCHVTKPYPVDSCLGALEAHVGRVETKVHFERVAWSKEKADAARVEDVTAPSGADLAVIDDGLDNNRVIYRYFPEDSCAIAEGCVGGPGFRRLLQFDASVKNLGAKALNIGDVDYFIEGKGTTLGDHHVYEFSECHQHYHFSHYGDFTLGTGAGQTGQKKAFCLQSTSRYSNNESSPLVNPYGGCDYQGIEAGWGDDYGAGLDCQWVDVTDVDTSNGAVTRSLAFASNPDGFLCEGTPVLDDEGLPTFEPTSFKTAEGDTVDRPVCEYADGWDTNNHGARDVTLPRIGGLVTSPCSRGQVGPLRDCGFTEEEDAFDRLSCTPGKKVELLCGLGPDGTEPQVLRVCERSAALETGVACTFRDALANTIVTGPGAKVTLTCPEKRDAVEKGGLLSFYAAPLLGGNTPGYVRCSGL